MRRILAALVVAVPITAFLTTGQAATQTDESEILAVIAAYDEAWNRRDADAFAALFTSDADQQISTGALRRGQAAIKQGTGASWSGVYRGTNLKTALESIRFITADLALVDTQFELLNISVGSKGARKGRRTVILVRSEGRWLITATRSMVPTPPGATNPS